MSDITEHYLREVLSKVASKYGLREWTYKRHFFESIGQNYFGVLIPVLLEGNQNGKAITLHLVLKLAPTDEKYRVSGAVTFMFAREIFVYSELLKMYWDMQDTFSFDHQYVMPKCYYVCEDYCNEVIALQNMCMSGYSPYTQSMFLDLNHIIIALKSLAKFHALSFILKEKSHAMYEKAQHICVPLTNRSNARYITILIDRLKKALNNFQNTEYVPLLEIFMNHCDYFIESVMYRVKKVCLCHGDMWKENILFKYKDSTPISACIIDYQTTRMSSPAFDVLYLIMSSVDTSLRKNHFTNLIDTYYETFKQCIANAHLDSKDIYSKEHLDYDLYVVGPACFIVANTAIWLSSGLQEEGHVKSKNQLVTEEEKLKALDQYKTIIKGIIDDLTRYGYMKVTELESRYS